MIRGQSLQVLAVAEDNISALFLCFAEEASGTTAAIIGSSTENIGDG